MIVYVSMAKTITININKCLRCDYEWQGRIEKPKACPECKTRLWNKPRNNDISREIK